MNANLYNLTYPLMTARAAALARRYGAIAATTGGPRNPTRDPHLMDDVLAGLPLSDDLALAVLAAYVEGYDEGVS